MVHLVHGNSLQTSRRQSSQHTASSPHDQDQLVQDHCSLERHLPTTMAAPYDQQQDHYAHRGFMPTNHGSWQDISPGTDSMAFSIHHPPAFFPADNAFHQHQDHTSQCASNDAHWQQQTPLASAPHNNHFIGFSCEPPIKPEESYPTNIEAVPPHDLPTSAASEVRRSSVTAKSPQSDHGWLSSSSDHPPEPKAIKRESVAFFVDNPPRLRPDGVRKKNARFEIPEDRKVDTIDKFISQADPNDEGLIRELKQQKRLLRNRQAALDSRSRKKEHTQRLEEERRALFQNIDQLKEELRRRDGVWQQERETWNAMVERLTVEKEELVRQHTLETADLRKKNNFLIEDVQRRPSLPMSAVPSSAGYSSTFSEFDHLSMNDSPTWDEFSLLNHHHAPTEPEPPKSKALTLARPRQGFNEPKENDRSPASGLLFMLLLCGAWVASKGSSGVSGMPQMSEDVQAASATVLDNIYKDAGLTAPGASHPDMTMDGSHSNHQLAANAAFNPMNNPFTTFNHLTTPTLQQRRDDAFAMTPSQYNAITTDDSLYSNTPHPSPPKDRRNFQDALAAMHPKNNKGSATDTYTKSLMWDEVPENIVRDFARMMGDWNAEPIH